MPLVDSIAAATPHLEAAGGGAIVAVSSTFGFDTIWPSSPNSYGAFKAAVAAARLVRPLTPLRPRGSGSTRSRPGPIEFEGGDWGNMKINRREIYDRVQATIPLGRHGDARRGRLGDRLPASPRSGFCVGTNVVCDGGMTARVQF